ncbi:MAG: glycosyltransferase family 39 protein [Abditibacteriales bacterium]|nr:glycosyltransferase family 39 protein [Abditibacteriales bacterium]MDW8366583.1 glycosyltransferase family 39 protein [Abditibacteriales bacterium]
MNPPVRWKNRLALTLILLLAFVLRLYGLRWGIPNAQHLHSYHPDEFDIAGRAAWMLARGDLNPHFFNYGSLTIYLTFFVGTIAFALGFINDLGGWHLVARLITVVFGTLTVGVVFLIGRTLCNETVGRVAAMFLAVLPGHVVHSHYATVDVPATFFITLSLLSAAHILTAPAMRWYALAGLSAGWAGACKYNAGIVMLCAFAAHIVRVKGLQFRAGADRSASAEHAGSISHNELSTVKPQTVGEPDSEPSTLNPPPSGVALLLTLFAAAVAFLLSCPYALLDFPQFHKNFMEEWRHVHQGHGLIFVNTGNGFWYHLTFNLPIALSAPLLVLSVLGFLGSLWERKPRDWMLAAFVVPYFFLIGSVQVRFLRYTLPLTPLLALYAAQWIEAWKWTRPPDGQELLRRAVRSLALVYALLYTLAHVAVFARPDPRDAAAAWMQQYKGASVGLLQIPWFQTPPLTEFNGGTKTKAQFEAERARWQYKFVITGWDTSILKEKRPQFFVMSEFEWCEEKRLQRKEWTAFLRALKAEGYILVKTFANPPRLWGWRVVPSYVPHDWLYPFPSVRIYRLGTSGTALRK